MTGQPAALNIPEPREVDPYIAPTVSFVEYAPNGAILQHGSMAEGFVRDMEDAGRMMLRVHGATMDMRVNLSTLELEPKPPCAAVVVGATVSNLPLPCRVHLDYEVFDIDDGVLELDLVQSGAYTIHVFSGTHMPGKYEVVV